MRLGGGAHGGPGLQGMDNWPRAGHHAFGLAQGPWPPCWEGGIHSREARVYSPPVPPRVGPPRCSGTVRGSRGAFSPIYSDFLGRIFIVIVELYSQLTTCSHTCFLFRNRPLEKSPHQSCRALRGEVDSSTPGVVGGLLVVVFEA